MNTTNEDLKPNNDVESPRRDASACGAGCACNAAGSTGKSRWIAGVVVLAAAGVLMARAIVKERGARTAPATSGFAALAVPEAPARPAVAPAAPAATPTVPAVAADSDAQSVVEAPPAAAAAAAEPTATGSLMELEALADLNGVAADSSGVFVFLPDQGGAASNAPMAQMRGAARMIEPQLRGGKIGMFALKVDSADYKQIAPQMAVPGVLAMVKGGGMRAASGDITETKLVQAFVGASSAGGCGPSSGGCGPASAGCN